MANNIKLSQSDYKLLYALEKDARKSVSKIAKEIRESKQKTYYRIKRLEKLGLILGYYAIIDVSNLGYTTYRIYLNLKNVDNVRRKEIIDFFVGIPEVAHVFSFDNIFDLGVGIVVKNVQDFHNVWHRVMKYKRNIANYHISIYSPIYHFTRTFLSPDTKDIPEILVLGAEQEIQYDDKDLAVLKSIASNVRKPIVDVAKEINESPQFVISRIKSLEKKKVIQGYKPIIDWGALGYDYYKVNITLSNIDKINELFSFCHTNPYIVQVDKTIGGWDFEFELFVRNKEHFNEIMDALTKKFPDTIEEYTLFMFDKVYKTTFFPV